VLSAPYTWTDAYSTTTQDKGMKVSIKDSPEDIKAAASLAKKQTNTKRMNP